MAYPHSEIEPKWQAILGTEQDVPDPRRGGPEPAQVLCAGHVPVSERAGAARGASGGYTATDIQVRYKRMKGFNVLHPMGWDSFGLPAEQYAIKTGEHPRKITDQNIDNFRRQLKMLGFSYDWDREVATTDEAYVRWTQWIFLQLFKRGLAYESEMPVNWSPDLCAVLANEEVEEWRAKGFSVERRAMRQWVLKITLYAERLLADLDGLDWPESIKEMQRNWIGKSEGRGGGLSRWAATRSACSRRGRTRCSARPTWCWRRSIRWWRRSRRRAARGRGGLPRGGGGQERSGAHGTGEGEDGGLHGGLCGQSGQRQGNPGVGGRLRAVGLRHGRDHGGAGARHARL
jgi:hypothetical protein